MNDRSNDLNPNMVLVFDRPDQTTAELVCATLQAAGLRATMQHQYAAPAAGMLPHLGMGANRGVLVPDSDYDAARAVLAEHEFTDADIEAEMAEDTETLEEAEARVK